MSVKNRVKLLAVLCASYTHQRHVKVDVAECEWLIILLGLLTDLPTDNKKEDKLYMLILDALQLANFRLNLSLF